MIGKETLESGGWIVDSHVHLHPSAFSPELLVNLCKSFHSYAKSRVSDNHKMAWCLADMPSTETLIQIQDRVFNSGLQEIGVVTKSVGDDRLEINSPDWSLTIIDGEQIVTKEGLELLVIGGKLRLHRTEKLHTAIDLCLAKNLLPILPWGVGKWLGYRGRVIAQLIKSRSYCRKMALADNGTRPVFWPYPQQLAQAAQSGYAVLHGSDSLSVCDDQMRTGRNGIVINDDQSTDALSAVRAVVDGSNSEFHAFGESMSIPRFIRTQTALRIERKK